MNTTVELKWFVLYFAVAVMLFMAIALDATEKRTDMTTASKIWFIFVVAPIVALAGPFLAHLRPKLMIEHILGRTNDGS